MIISKHLQNYSLFYNNRIILYKHELRLITQMSCDMTDILQTLSKKKGNIMLLEGMVMDDIFSSFDKLAIAP